MVLDNVSEHAVSRFKRVRDGSNQRGLASEEECGHRMRFSL